MTGLYVQWGMNRLFVLLFVSLVFLGACKKDDPVVEEDQGQVDGISLLLSDTLIQSWTQSELSLAAQFSEFSDQVDKIQYGVDIYKISYSTPYKGVQVQASGLLCVPKDYNDTLPIPIISAHHGTIFHDDQAPSSYSNSNTQASNQLELLASAGYVVLIPDYLGFGDSKDLAHPYYDKAHSVTAVMDFMKAGIELLERDSVVLKEEVFLFGYSEGGYVTMAVQQAIEMDVRYADVKLAASAIGAGGYSLNGILNKLVAQEIYSSPNYLANVIYGYQQTNDWPEDLSDYFQSSYADTIPALLNGSYTGSEVNASLTDTLENLLNTTFWNKLNGADGGETKIRTALSVNSVASWVPMKPTRMYHGTDDLIVPFDDSKETAQRFNEKGAIDVTFIPIDGANHSTGLVPMVKDVIEWFPTFE